MALLIPLSLKLPSSLLSLVKCRSPWYTLISTSLWKLPAVVNIFDALVGMAEFLGMMTFATPPRVSMDSERGVTSMRRMSFTLFDTVSSPLSLLPWTAAPMATHSSGFIFLDGSLPVMARTLSTTAGIRVEPPTSSTLSI